MTLTRSISSEDNADKILNRLEALEKDHQDLKKDVYENSQRFKVIEKEQLKHSSDLSEIAKNMVNLNKTMELLLK